MQGNVFFFILLADEMKRCESAFVGLTMHCFWNEKF